MIGDQVRKVNKMATPTRKRKREIQDENHAFSNNFQYLRYVGELKRRKVDKERVLPTFKVGTTCDSWSKTPVNLPFGHNPKYGDGQRERRRFGEHSLMQNMDSEWQFEAGPPHARTTGGAVSPRHRSVTPKFVTPTAPSCIDNSWRSTTLPGADSASSNQTLPFQNEHEWVLEKIR